MGDAHHQSIMYALFSKGFGKKAQDLNKKEFDDGKTRQEGGTGAKFITKATTADKTAFESNVTAKGEADVKFTVPVDSNFKVGVKAYQNKDTEVDVDFKFDDNLTLKSTVKNLDPTLSDKTMKITAGADYVTEAFSVESSFTLCDEGAFFSQGKTGGAVAFATSCPGMDWLRVGVQAGFAQQSEGVGINTNVAFAHATKEYELAAQLSVGDLLNKHQLAGGSLRGWFNASNAMQIAAEVDVNGGIVLARDMWAA